MGDKLTEFLGSDSFPDWDYPEVLPTHPTFPHLSKPDTLQVYPLRECKGCPQLGNNTNDGHISYERGILTGPITGWKPVTLDLLRFMQYGASRVSSSLVQMWGSQEGLLYNGLATANFADFQAYNIISVDADTLTVEKQDESNCGINTWGFDSFIPEDTIFKTFQTRYGLPQPNDEVEFMAPSALATKARPSIRRIKWDASLPNQMQIVCDQSVEHAMTLGDESAAGFSGPYSIKVWRQAGDPERWGSIVDPAPMRCVEKRQVITLASELNADGIIELKSRENSSCRIAVPEDAADNMRASWKSRAFYISGGAEDIDTKARVRVVQNVSGTWQTFLCLGLKDHTGATVFAEDLRSTVSKLVILFFPEAAAGALKWKAPCSARCKHDVVDKNGNEITGVSGFGASAGGTRHYCNQVNAVAYSLVPNGSGGYDSVPSFSSPTGIGNYVPSRCYQYLTCDKFSVLKMDDSAEGIWSFWKSFPRYVRELTASVNVYLVQLFPAIASYANIKIGRAPDGNPSLRQLLGRPFMPRTPIGMHASVLDNVDEGLIADYEIETDIDGNKSLVERNSGHAWRPSQDWSAVAFGDKPEDGLVPDIISGHKNKPKILDQSVNDGDPEDPYGSVRVYEDNIGGTTCKLDEMTIGGRNYADTPIATTAEKLLCPRVNLDSVGETQDRNEMTAQVLSSPVTRAGKLCSLEFTFKPIRPDEKAPIVSGSGQVHSVIDMGGGIYRIVLENKSHSWSQIVGLSGDRHDEIISWFAGGNVGCPDHLRIDNYYENEKTLGSGTHPVWIGDSVSFPSAVVPSDPQFSTRAFLVVAVKAHAIENTDWALKTITKNFTVTGYWEPADNRTKGDAVTLQLMKVDGNHSSSALTIQLEFTAAIGTFPCVVTNSRTGEQMKVTAYSEGTKQLTIDAAGRGWNGTTAQAINDDDFLGVELVTQPGTLVPFVRMLNAAKPTSIPSGSYWWDSSANYFYFNGSDYGTSVDIRWKWETEPNTAAYAMTQAGYIIGTPNIPPHYVAAESYVDTGVESATLAGYVGYSVKYVGGATLTKVVSNPAQGQYVESFDVSTHLVVTLNRADAGDRVSVIFDTGDTATSPGEVARTLGYGTWGPYRDYIDLKDDVSGFLAEAVTEGGLDGETANFEQSRQVFVPGIVPKSTEYRTNSYAAIPSEDWVEESGNGKAWITKSWVDAKTGSARRQCFLFEVKRMDLRSLPSKRTVDGMINQLQICNRGFCALGGGLGLPSIQASLEQQAYFTEAHWAADCGSGFDRFAAVAGSVWQVGLRRGMTWEPYVMVNINWHMTLTGGLVFVSGYGFFDGSIQSGDDFLLSGSGNQLNIMLASRRTDGLGGYPINAHYYDGTSDPDQTPRFATFPHDVGENWTTNGSGPKACPTPESIWYTTLVHGPGGVLLGMGPGYESVIVGEALYNREPFGDTHSIPNYSLLGVNHIGPQPPETYDPINMIFSEGNLGAVMSIGGGPAFGLPYLLKRIPAGSVILEAKLEVLISDLHNYTYTLSSTVEDEELVTTADLTDDTSSVGCALIGGKIVNPATGFMQYDIIATGLGSSLTPDKWDILDCTDVLQLMIDSLRDSPYFRISLVPAPSAAAFASGDPKAVLARYLPDVSYGMHVGEDNNTGWYNPGLGDISYQASYSGSWTEWGSIQYGTLWIKFQLPDSERTRTIQHFAIPLLATPS